MPLPLICLTVISVGSLQSPICAIIRGEEREKKKKEKERVYVHDSTADTCQSLYFCTKRCGDLIYCSRPRALITIVRSLNTTSTLFEGRSWSLVLDSLPLSLFVLFTSSLWQTLDISCPCTCATRLWSGRFDVVNYFMKSSRQRPVVNVDSRGHTWSVRDKTDGAVLHSHVKSEGRQWINTVNTHAHWHAHI